LDEESTRSSIQKQSSSGMYVTNMAAGLDIACGGDGAARQRGRQCVRQEQQQRSARLTEAHGRVEDRVGAQHPVQNGLAEALRSQ
jgi:hypothetical protein